MLQTDGRFKVLAVCLSTLAGFVDALGFIKLGGFFVSFMSGNTTRLAVGLAQGSRAALIAVGLIGLFVLGVMLGSYVSSISKTHRQSAVLFLVSGLLGISALNSWAGMYPTAIATMTLAMGAENTVFERGGEVHIGLTYMTGTLVKFGQRLTAALQGGEPFGWVPYFLLWIGLVTGAILGALIFPMLQLQALWLAAGVALALALLVRRFGADTSTNAQ